MMKRVLALVLASLMVFCLTGAEKPKKFPKNVEVQVPAKAGGGTDVMARALAEYVSKASGSTVTIVNNTAGNGVVPMEKVRTDKKGDGSTILQFHTSMLINSASGVYKYNAADDFKVIGISHSKTQSGYVVVANPSVPYNTFGEMAEYAKAHPGEVLIGVQTGGTTHLQACYLMSEGGFEAKAVEAGSDTEKLTTLVGGGIHVALVNANQARQYLEAGKVKAIGVFTDAAGTRSEIVPDVPTFVEQGYPNLYWDSINLFLGPKSMSDETAQYLYELYAAAAEDEGVNEILGKAGMAMTFYPYEEGIEVLKANAESVNKLVEAAGLKVK